MSSTQVLTYAPGVCHQIGIIQRNRPFIRHDHVFATVKGSAAVIQRGLGGLQVGVADFHQDIGFGAADKLQRRRATCQARCFRVFIEMTLCNRIQQTIEAQAIGVIERSPAAGCHADDLGGKTLTRL